MCRSDDCTIIFSRLTAKYPFERIALQRPRLKPKAMDIALPEKFWFDKRDVLVAFVFAIFYFAHSGRSWCRVAFSDDEPDFQPLVRAQPTELTMVGAASILNDYSVVRHFVRSTRRCKIEGY